jgi:tetratricopeptide (TPR) repeat protein
MQVYRCAFFRGAYGDTVFADPCKTLVYPAHYFFRRLLRGDRRHRCRQKLRVPALILCILGGLAGCQSAGEWVGAAVSGVSAKSKSSSADKNTAGTDKSNPYLTRIPRLTTDLQTRFDQALAYMAAERWAEAEIVWRSLAAQLPKASGVDLNLAICLMNQDKLAEALEVARQGIAKNPQNVELYNRAGLIARAMGDFEAASSFYQSGIAQWSSYAPLHLNLGILREVYQGQLAPALTHYEAYQALQEPPDPMVAKWIVDLQRRIGSR